VARTLRAPRSGAASPRREDSLARLYDVDLLDDPGDLDLYRALAARTGGPILELGVGTGRLAVPLAAGGASVTGVDRDEAMLKRARARATAAGLDDNVLRLVAGDLREAAVPDQGSFGLAFIALNSLMLLPTRAAQAAAVAALAAPLAPGGIAVVDVWLPDADDLGRFDGRLVLEYVREDPDTGLTVTKAAAARHDAATATVDLTVIYDETAGRRPVARWIRHDRLRLVPADDLVAFGEAAGLELETLAGGYDLEPLGPGSDRAILVARKR
jgi:SAM-dependent methyltransferase